MEQGCRFAPQADIAVSPAATSAHALPDVLARLQALDLLTQWLPRNRRRDRGPTLAQHPEWFVALLGRLPFERVPTSWRGQSCTGPRRGIVG
jgi:hypothetical protein